MNDSTLIASTHHDKTLALALSGLSLFILWVCFNSNVGTILMIGIEIILIGILIIRLSLQKSSRFQEVKTLLSSMTESTVCLCRDDSDLPIPLPTLYHQTLPDKYSVSLARRTIISKVKSLGFSDRFCSQLECCAAESLMNSYVHGNKNARVTLCGNDKSIQLWVIDEGEGIPMDYIIPAVSQPGWSSTNTLGMGFTLINSEATSVSLLTNQDGTTIVITIDRE